VNIQCSLCNNITLYMPYYPEGRVGIPYTSLTPPHFCACPKPGPGFPKSYDVGFFSVQWISLRWEGIVSFIDFGGIDGHHSLHILFIIFIRLSRDGPYYVIGYGGWRVGVHTGFRTITLVLYIGSLPNLATWLPCGRGRTLFILGSLGQRSRSLLL
jgi:hypothetical protein